MSDFFVRCSKILPAICLAIISFQTTNSFAQIKVEIDEDVKVPFLGDWLDGVVVDIDKKRNLLVEFSFGGSSQQRVFGRKEVRKLYEYEGLDFGRNWESASGKFKVEASLLKFLGEEVVLIKPDMTELTVPLAKLSKRDNVYVNKFKKNFAAAVKRGEIPDATPALPELESFSGGFGSGSTFVTGSAAQFESVGPLPNYLKDFKQAGTGFNLIRRRQKLVAVIPVGGPERLVLMSFRERNPFKKGDRFQSQLYWVSLKKKKVVNFVSITHEDYAIDYDPRNQLLLTNNRKEEFIGEIDEPDHYTLWKLAPGGTKAKPIVRWTGSGMNWAQTLFGKIVNDRIVVVKTDRQTYEAFDVVDKKTAYVVKSQSFFDAPVVITQDRQNLILPEDGQVSIVDAATGEFKMTAKVNDRHVSGANTNDAGTKLAAITERNIYVWDLESGNKEPTIYPAPLMGSPFKSRVEWIGDDYILGESHQERVLYQLSLKLPVWSYKMDVFQYFLNRDPLTNMVVNGRFFYVARPDVWGGSIAVGAVDMPGPGVAEVVTDIDRDSLLIMKPGVHVGLRLNNIQEKQKVEGWLKEKIKENEWIYDPDAAIVMHANMGIGKSQRVTYQEFGLNGQSTNVSFKPHYANLKLMKDELIIWQTGTSTGAPDFVRVRGDDLQGAIKKEVNKYQTPQLAFFKGVRIDREIIDPKYSRGFGQSVLGLRGIQVVSTSPPGRENDPLAASQKADEDRKKAAEEEGKNEPDGTESDSDQ